MRFVSSMERLISGVSERILQNESGAVAVVTAAVLLPMLTAVGAGTVDYNKMLSAQNKLQSTLDSALLKVGRQFDLSTESPDNIRSELQKIFDLNAKAIRNLQEASIVSLTPNDNGGMRVSASAKVPMSFMGLMGYDSVIVTVSSEIDIVQQSGVADVVFVLDTSYPMIDDIGRIPSIESNIGLKIDLMKWKVEKYIDALLGKKGNNSGIQVGIVPYGSTVRLNSGAGYRNKSWMDTNALSPVHSENFAEPVNRFKLYDELDLPWRGCLEVRPQPYDVHDYDPRPSDMDADEVAMNTPRTARFFVPWFAPDEIVYGLEGARDQHTLNYLYEEYPPRLYYGSEGLPKGPLPSGLDRDFVATATDDELKFYAAMANVKKYKKSHLYPRRLHDFLSVGLMSSGAPEDLWHVANLPRPQRYCDDLLQVRGIRDWTDTSYPRVSEMVELTNDAEMLLDKLRYMGYYGPTNILPGLTWGWRALTPGEPFTTGRKGTRKVLVWIAGGPNMDPLMQARDLFRRVHRTILFNESRVKTFLYGQYGAYGIPAVNRLKIPLALVRSHAEVDRGVARVEVLNERVKRACKHIKANGIEIYAATFGMDAEAAGRRFKSLVEGCASSKDHYRHIVQSLYGYDFEEFFELIGLSGQGEPTLVD